MSYIDHEIAEGTNVLLVCDDSVLLLQRDTNVWEYPGGTFDKTLDQTILDCAEREVLEETGIIIAQRTLRKLGDILLPGDTYKGSLRGPIREHYYVGHVALQPIRLSTPHVASRWAPRDKAQHLLPASSRQILDMLSD